MKSLRLITLLGLAALSFSSCVKKEYDEPDTANVDPSLTITHTINALNNMAGSSTIPMEITTDVVIAGVVIADDEYGNFYKEVLIQDSTSGIAIQLDVSNFYTNYPIGRRLWIKAKGLYIANDGDNNYQLGIKDGTTIGRIPAGLADRYIVKGKWGIPVTPKLVTLSNITSAKGNTLIQLNDVEFANADTGQVYADGINLVSKNRMVEDCPGNTVKMYTSGYAKFANELTPGGKGSLVAVNRFYNGASELIIRDPRDVKMTGTRCNVTAQISIDSLRNSYPGATTTLPTGIMIKGIVISDYTNIDTDPKNIVLQDGNRGVVVRFTAAHAFPMGAQVAVNVSGQSLTLYNGLMEVNGVPNANAVQTGTGTVTPNIVTCAQINANMQTLESTLVKIQNATISGATANYSGNNTVTDATGTVTLYTRSAATFSATAYPTGSVSITGFLGQYSGTNQISIRNTTDVQ